MNSQIAKVIPSQNNPTDLKTVFFSVEKQEFIDLKNQANRWKSLFERKQKKVEELEKIIQKKDGIIKTYFPHKMKPTFLEFLASNQLK